MQDHIYRCSDGHLYTATVLRQYATLGHMGSAQLHRCPFDHRWRMTRPANANELSEEQIDDAHHHRL